MAEKNRAVKPNFSLGTDKTDYMTQQAAILVTPGHENYLGRANPQNVALL